MKPDQRTLRFFLGSNTPQGFVSRFDQFADPDDGWRLYVIKGGAGSGKSTLMKKVAEALREKHGEMEMITCSSDVDSIDGVIVPDLKFSICDGTPPHSVEPKYPGVVESIVDMTSCWDDAALFAHRNEIIPLTRSISKYHEHCCRFLAAAGSLMGDTYRIALDSVNTSKLAGYCNRLCEREFKTVRPSPGKEMVRFLSAPTNKGIVTFLDTAKQLCSRIYLISDEHGAISRLLLNSVRAKALAAGCDIISCYCPLGPFDKLEHLFVPSLGLGFLTSNRFHDFNDDVDPFRIVNSQRFSEKEKLTAGKRRILFNRKAAAQMLRQAESLLADAKSLHDELESYYIHATDFDKVDALTADVLRKIDAF